MSTSSCRKDLPQLLPPTTNFTTKQHNLLLVKVRSCVGYATSTCYRKKTVRHVNTICRLNSNTRSKLILLGENPINSIEENTGMPKTAPVNIKCHMDNMFVDRKVFELYADGQPFDTRCIWFTRRLVAATASLRVTPALAARGFPQSYQSFRNDDQLLERYRFRPEDILCRQASFGEAL